MNIIYPPTKSRTRTHTRPPRAERHHRHQPPSDGSLDCPDCGTITPILYWYYMSSGGLHLGARCPACTNWLKWLPQTDAWLRTAPPLEPAWGRSA